MIEIDGSTGEGGGQMLRSSLTLSVMTGQRVRIFNIRSGRKNSGLRAQHLEAVRAAAKICNADLSGDYIGSKEISLSPGGVHSGRYTIKIETAGSTSLVLQTILIPLSKKCSSSSFVSIAGGTHILWSPSYHYLEFNWLPVLTMMGYDVKLDLLLAGFFPKGGGRINATIRPARDHSHLQMIDRGKLLRILGVSMVSNLNMSIAHRQKAQAVRRLEKYSTKVKIRSIKIPSKYKGTMLLVLAEFENGQCCYYSLGELGKPAERVADEAVDQLEEFITSDGALDQFLADQLIMPMCFANGISEIRTSKITQHLITNAEIAQQFLPCLIEINGEINQPGIIKVIP